MKKYKVRFKNNKVVSAELFEPEAYNDQEFLNIVSIDGKNYVDWITVFADDQQDAFNAADTVVKQYLLNSII
jgi:hypothetical protein